MSKRSHSKMATFRLNELRYAFCESCQRKVPSLAQKLSNQTSAAILLSHCRQYKDCRDWYEENRDGVYKDDIIAEMEEVLPIQTRIETMRDHDVTDGADDFF